MKKTLFALPAFAVLFLSSCSSTDTNKEGSADNTTVQNDTSQKKPAPNPYANATIEVRTYNNDLSAPKEGEPKFSGWGYDIYINGARTIVQPNAPALPGNAGFKTEADAKKVGELMAYKIKNNIMPPMVTVEELDSLGVFNK